MIPYNSFSPFDSLIGSARDSVAMMIMIWIISKLVVAYMMSHAAKEKGYEGTALIFAAVFFLDIFGCLYVVALPDKRLQRNVPESEMPEQSIPQDIANNSEGADQQASSQTKQEKKPFNPFSSIVNREAVATQTPASQTGQYNTIPIQQGYPAGSPNPSSNQDQIIPLQSTIPVVQSSAPQNPMPQQSVVMAGAEFQQAQNQA